MTLATLLFNALLAIFPNAPTMPCLLARHDALIAQVEASAERYQVPVGLMLSVAFVETHISCDRASYGNFGAPISRTQRHTAGNADSEASALAMGHRRCHTWEGAVSSFRCGMCVCPRNMNYVRNTMSLTRRLYTRVNREIPDGI